MSVFYWKPSRDKKRKEKKRKKRAHVESLEVADHHHVVGHFQDDRHDVQRPRQRLHLLLQRRLQLVDAGGVAADADAAAAAALRQNVQPLLRVAHQVAQQQFVPNFLQKKNKFD